jgi:hypothetical protein
MFESPEDEMKHFLEMMGSPDWVWAEQYEYTDKKDETMLMQDSVTFLVDNDTESMFIIFIDFSIKLAGILHLELTHELHRAH